MKLHELAKKLGKSNTDTKLLLSDLGIDFDNITDEIAEKIITQANIAKKQTAITGQAETIENKGIENKQETTLQSARAINYQVNLDSENAIIQGAKLRGETLANLATAIESNAFINQLSANKVDFASCYLQSLNNELNQLIESTQGKLLANTAPLDQIQNLTVRLDTTALQPKNWMK